MTTSLVERLRKQWTPATYEHALDLIRQLNDERAEAADRIEELERQLAAPLSTELPCQTCNGHGRVGGPTYYAPDEGGEPCPDCTIPPQPDAALSDEELDELIIVELHKLNLSTAAWKRLTHEHGPYDIDRPNWEVSALCRALLAQRAAPQLSGNSGELAAAPHAQSGKDATEEDEAHDEPGYAAPHLTAEHIASYLNAEATRLVEIGAAAERATPGAVRAVSATVDVFRLAATLVQKQAAAAPQEAPQQEPVAWELVWCGDTHITRSKDVAEQWAKYPGGVLKAMVYAAPVSPISTPQAAPNRTIRQHAGADSEGGELD